MVRLAFPDDPRMVLIAAAESTGTEGEFDEKAFNKTSSAKGLFEITADTWKDNGCTGNIFKAEDNIACAVLIYKDRDVQPWEASREIWSGWL